MGRGWRILLIGVVCVVTVLPIPARASDEPVRTAVRFVVPFGPAGLSADLTVTAEETGSCIAGSLADAGRADAWRCTAGNAILDPCFVSPFAVEGDPGRLACLASAFSRDVVLLTLSEPVPTNLANRPAAEASSAVSPSPLPWALELANGDQCEVATGATAALVGLRMNYFCVGKGAILGIPDRSGPVWTVVYWADGAAVTDAVAVITAWS